MIQKKILSHWSCCGNPERLVDLNGDSLFVSYWSRISMISNSWSRLIASFWESFGMQKHRNIYTVVKVAITGLLACNKNHQARGASCGDSWLKKGPDLYGITLVLSALCPLVGHLVLRSYTHSLFGFWLSLCLSLAALPNWETGAQSSNELSSLSCRGMFHTLGPFEFSSLRLTAKDHGSSYVTLLRINMRNNMYTFCGMSWRTSLRWGPTEKI